MAKFKVSFKQARHVEMEVEADDYKTAHLLARGAAFSLERHLLFDQASVKVLSDEQTAFEPSGFERCKEDE